MRTGFNMDITLTEIDSNALEYIIDLIQSDMNAHKDNTVRGNSLFQNVYAIAGLMKQEIYIARNKQEVSV